MGRNEIFIIEICAKAPKKNYATNKTNVYYIDDTWSMDILDLIDYGPKNIEVSRYVLVLIDNFSKFGCTSPLKNKNAQTIKSSWENILEAFQMSPKMVETDDVEEFVNKFLLISEVKTIL